MICLNTCIYLERGVESTNILCIVVYCTVLYCTVLYCTVLYCTAQLCNMYCNIQLCNMYCPLAQILLESNVIAVSQSIFYSYTCICPICPIFSVSMKFWRSNRGSYFCAHFLAVEYFFPPKFHTMFHLMFSCLRIFN